MASSDPITTADVLIPLGAAILGAIAGGGASAAGSLLVNRREIARMKRIYMYDELLPSMRARITAYIELMDDRNPPTSPKTHELRALSRAAAIAGRRDSAYAAEITELAEELADLLDDFGTRHDRTQLFNELYRQQNRIVAKIDEFSEWLHKRV